MSVSKRVTDPLQIQLFGAVQVLYQGQPLKFRSRKVLALLIYLAVEGGAHERDKLAALLWPESDQQQGRTALRVTLGRLRQALAVAGEFIITEGRRIGFDFTQTFELDVQMVDVVTTALAAATPPEAMQSALDHLRGEFLEGYSVEDAPDFESWASSQREWWHRRGDELFAAVGRQQLALAHFAAAVDTAIRWTHYAPFNESAHRCLIEAHALNGNRSAAWQAYAVCQQILADELGIDPSPETTALAARVKQGHIPRTDRPKMASPPATGQAAPAAVPQSPVIPLVGRAAEYGRLFATYQQAARGALQAAAIVGEAGMGKTRLAEALLDWAALETAPADVLRGRAFEIGGHLPYQPVVDALRQRLERENAPDDLLDDIWLAELSQLLPELRSRYPDLPPPLAGNADFVQARLFEVVALLGAALAQERPLILFIDDLQWADSGSREMLHYLARRWSAQQIPALLLLTIRQEGLQTVPELREWLVGLGRDATLTRLELTPLTERDLTELAQTLAGDGAGITQFSDWLVNETGGSPFFVTELLQYLAQQSLLVASSTMERHATGQPSFDLAATLKQLNAGPRVPLPPTMRELILGRLGRLSDKAGALLLAGAVIGRRCTFERLCQVARLDEFDGLPALEDLLQSRLMLETVSEARPFTFAHDNIRDIVYTEAGATRRRLYHRQAFTVLEQDKAPAAELTFHAVAAGLNQPAFTYAVAAGDEAMAVHAFTDAVIFYEQALHLTDQVAVA
ncbi:MAG: AAA family ATPase, partial [Caldilineaceae bacterium]|nr:AAA family ATPase [Caldilineaceae bacterium]